MNWWKKLPQALDITGPICWLMEDAGTNWSREGSNRMKASKALNCESAW